MLGDPAREEEFERLRATLEVMAAAGIEAVLFYTTPARPSDPDEEERAFERFVTFCTRLGAAADDLGIGIACHPWVSRPELLFGFRRLQQMCERVPHSKLGITYCPGGALAGDCGYDRYILNRGPPPCRLPRTYFFPMNRRRQGPALASGG